MHDQIEADFQLDKKIDDSVEEIQEFLELQVKVSSNQDVQLNEKLKEIQNLSPVETISEAKIDWLFSSYMNEIHDNLRDQKNDSVKLNSDINNKLKDMLYCLREHKQLDSAAIKSLDQKIDRGARIFGL